MIDARIAELKAAGRAADVSAHPEARPDYLEAEAVARLLRIAEAADAPVVIVHLTNREALDEVALPRARGQRVYVETCPQYLALDDGVYYDANWSMAARYVCAPPIRAEENQRALWRGLRRGEIQTISTDHCSFTLAQKDMGREDFTKIPGGLPGVETRGEVVYTRGVAAGRMTVAGMCRALCENPAKLYGLYPRKGVIAAGSDADIVVYDPKASHILSARDMVTKAGYTPFEGLRTEGGIAKVYLRGSLMVEDGRIVGGPRGSIPPPRALHPLSKTREEKRNASMNLRTILFSQYPALFLLAVLFLIAHLRVRKTSAVKSVLWVILFGAALAASVVLLPRHPGRAVDAQNAHHPRLLSWFGVGLVLLFLVLRVVHGMEKRSSRRRLDKAMKQAEKQKEEEVSRAPAPRGAAAERERAEAEAAARAEEAAREEAARAAAEAAAAQDAPSGETAPAEANRSRRSGNGGITMEQTGSQRRLL